MFQHLRLRFWLRRLKTSNDLEEQQQIINCIAGLPDDNAIEGLVRAWRVSDSPEVTMRLIDMGSKVVPYLSTVFVGQPEAYYLKGDRVEWRVRTELVKVFRGIRDSESLSALLHAFSMMEVTDYFRLTDAIVSFGENAISDLEKIAIQSKWEQCAVHAVNAIHEIGGDLAIAAVERIARSGDQSNGKGQGQAVEVLAKLDPQKYSGVFESIIQDASMPWSPKYRAIWALAALKSQEARRFLERGALVNPDTRSTALKALGAIGDARSIPVIVKAAEEATNLAFRDDAVRILISLGGGPAATEFIFKYTSERRSPAGIAVAYLASRDDPRFTSALCNAIQTALPGVKNCAIEGLLRISKNCNARKALVSCFGSILDLVREFDRQDGDYNMLRRYEKALELALTNAQVGEIDFRAIERARTLQPIRKLVSSTTRYVDEDPRSWNPETYTDFQFSETDWVSFDAVRNLAKVK